MKWQYSRRAAAINDSSRRKNKVNYFEEVFFNCNLFMLITICILTIKYQNFTILLCFIRFVSCIPQSNSIKITQLLSHWRLPWPMGACASRTSVPKFDSQPEQGIAWSG